MSLGIIDAYKLLHKGTLALARAERQGIRMDVGYVTAQQKKLEGQIKQLTLEVKQTDFFKDWQSTTHKTVNMHSSKQLGIYLYEHLKLNPTKFTQKGAGSVDDATLQQLKIPGIDKLLRIKKLMKIKDTYLESISREVVDGYIHPFFNLNTVTTYRSSSSDPNFQNIPVRDPDAKKIVRRAFYPRPGHQLLEVDYGSIEVRVGACYHKDPVMINYVKDPTTDMHRDMACEIFKCSPEQFSNDKFKILRASAKNAFVFPQFYGDYYKNNAIGIARWLGLPKKTWKGKEGLELAQGYHITDHLVDNGIRSYNKLLTHLQQVEDSFWNERFVGYRDWKKRAWRQYQKQGYFDTLTGFRIQGVMSFNDLVNYPIQGSAFHCLLWSLVEVDRRLKEEGCDTRIVGQIHDSLVFDVLPDELKFVLKMVRKVTCKLLPKIWHWIIVPLEIEAELCDVDQSWYHKKEIKI